MPHIRTNLRPLTGLLAATLLAASFHASDAHAAVADACEGAPSNVFADVPVGSTHEANIDCIAAHGITVGVGGGNYDPGGTVQRGQMASFLVNFYAVATVSEPHRPEASPFEDIAGTTHASNIRAAASLGLTSGRTPTSYAPLERVTRAQMATFVAQALRAAGADLADGPDRFGDDDGSIHEGNIDALAAAGVVNGVDASRYDPQGFVSRAQMATFLANAAGLLAEQGRWFAASLSPGDPGPRAELVVAAGAALDIVEVRWDRTIAGAGGATTITVTDADDTQVVSTGQTHTSLTSTTTHLTLDTALTAAGTYWLQLAEGAATDGEGRTNTAQRIAFVFSPSTVGDGGGGGGGGAVAPTIVTIVTEPGLDRLLVTFDQDVTCPAGGTAAWSFTNNSVIEAGTQATGSPDSISQPTSTTCALVYSVDGVENGDFGTMTYTQPADVGLQVSSTTGMPLSTVAGVRVSDGVAPTFDGVNANAGSEVVLVSFSEPIACSTLSPSEFSASINSVPVDVDLANCPPGPASSAISLTLSAPPLAGQQVSIAIGVGTTLSDQSLDNQVLPATRSLQVL